MMILSLIAPKKISWILLFIYFIFDFVVSYYAISYKNGREANLLIAPFVERYPFLYFLLIPITMITVFVIVKVLSGVIYKLVGKREELGKEKVRLIVLTAMAIYWPLANSFMNVAFILGYPLPSDTWITTSLVGIILAGVYLLITLKFTGLPSRYL